MTNEKQAVKTLADELAKALNNVKNNPVAINASQVVGLPSALYSVLNTLEYKSEEGDEIATKLLNYFHNIAALEVGTIAADEAQIGTLYATFGDFMHLVAESASVGSLDVGQLRADMAAIGLLTLSTADINTAQIEHLSTQDAFIKYGVGGKLYIEDLAISNANIVSLAAGSIMIKDSNGNMVELYVDDQSHISTRPVSYDGDDIINSGSLNGNRIIENSITTNRLNTDEIFAYQGMVMNLVVDNIDATRLFANQGVITQLETTVISSPAIGSGIDISGNSTIQMLQDAIELTASNAGRTYIDSHMPFPKLKGDTWFNPSTEEHYVSTGIDMETFPDIAYDDYGNLRVRRKLNSDYNVQLDSNGYFKVYDDIPETHYSIVDGYLNVDGAWKKIDNVAFSNLKISVDGISATVFDSQTGESRIDQSANRISMIVNGTTAVPHVETSSIVIENNKLEISSSGNVDIKANNFSIGFNTSGSASNISRVDINNTDGIKVSDQYGNYFKATTNGIGLYDINNVPNIYMNSNGDAIFAGKMSAECITSGHLSASYIQGGVLTLGGLNNDNGSIKILDASGNTIGTWNSNGINATAGTFSGDITGATGTFSGEMSASGINGGTLTLGGPNGGMLIVKNAAGGEIGRWDNGGIRINAGMIDASKASISNINADSISTGTIDARIINVTHIDADEITSGTISADVIEADSISVDKLTGTIENNNWKLDLKNGTFTIGNISADNIVGGTIDANVIGAGTITADKIKGGTLTLGGHNNNNGSLELLDDGNNNIGIWDYNGATIRRGTIKNYSTDGNNYASLADSSFQMWGNVRPVASSIAEWRMIASMHNYMPSGGSIADCMMQLNSNANILVGALSNEFQPNITLYARGGVAPTDYTSQILVDTNQGIYLQTYDNVGNDAGILITRNFGTTVYGNFAVTGTKNRIVSTDQYSDRLLYCYETPSPMFGDIGEGVIAEDGSCYIWLDPIFAQTISTDQYQVFLQRYGAGDCYVSERKGGCFVVTGTPGLRFGWEIKAKQKDFDQRRLERNDKAFTVPDSTYGADAAQYISDLKKGRVSV